MEDVEDGRDDEWQEKKQHEENQEEPEADPSPGSAAVLAPQRSDVCVADCDHLQQNELQAGTDVEEDETDDQRDDANQYRERHDECEKCGRKLLQSIGAARDVKVEAPAHLGEEGYGGDLEKCA
jgi:hypothetical protein